MDYKCAYEQARAVLDMIAASSQSHLDICGNTICFIELAPDQADVLFQEISFCECDEPEVQESTWQPADTASEQIQVNIHTKSPPDHSSGP
ncbi:hypothetical protein SAMN04515647_4361 [Cohaesibacter sp. ES.047]|nr:hypothetical protein SAMN04515647_4361 [Cohaesibacter sp. ES.047]